MKEKVKCVDRDSKKVWRTRSFAIADGNFCPGKVGISCKGDWWASCLEPRTSETPGNTCLVYALPILYWVKFVKKELSQWLGGHLVYLLGGKVPMCTGKSPKHIWTRVQISMTSYIMRSSEILAIHIIECSGNFLFPNTHSSKPVFKL